MDCCSCFFCLLVVLAILLLKENKNASALARADMDDTLYPLSLGINLACRKNIQEYMLNKLRIEESQVPRMCLDLYREYGTTMAGLKVLGYGFDYDDFHACVHGTLPYEKVKPDPVLRQLLLSLPQRKIIFTNSDKAHAARVLEKLGLQDCFQGIVCFETLNPRPPTETEKNSSGSAGTILCKPSLASMEAVIEIAKLDAERTVFFDDSARNIAAGKAAGFRTVIVGSSALVPGADVALESIHNIKEALPELWEVAAAAAAGDRVDAVLRSTTAVETTVIA
uniref:Haloacid dehalogenase-like hydrolase (HAD) superfamily protein n=1 Tax=Zea mays TaxID=4577 RepID=A0A804UEY6_MAIZE